MKGYLYRLNVYFKDSKTPYYILSENEKSLIEKLKDIPDIKIVEKVSKKKLNIENTKQFDIIILKEGIENGNLLIIK